MSNPDDALRALRQISSDYGAFLAQRGKVSEADTRANLIDRVLKETLLWPESALSREDHVDTGFIDYTLTVGSRAYVAVEAKRSGDAFVLPAPSSHRTASLSGALVTDPAIKGAIEQVRAYCDAGPEDAGPIRYAIATNGYTWIVFRAIREDIHWRKGRARVFDSIEDIQEHFTNFWNLLSYGAICTGSLDEEFGSGIRISRALHRVRDKLFNADLPLQRNAIHTQIAPIVRTVFEDIADQGEVEILKSCYVHSKSLRIVADDINCVITDAMPAFLKSEGAIDIQEQHAKDSGAFGHAVDIAVSAGKGQIFLLLGGVGAGKTTFLKRYERYVGASLLAKDTVWFHVNFLSAPLTAEELEDFFWRTVLADIRSRYGDQDLESWGNLQKTFARDINALPRPPSQQGRKLDEKSLEEFLRRRQEDPATYVPPLLRAAAARNQKALVLFIDNVDQLSPTYQAQIFMLAQRITETLGSITIIAMREESYYAASIQKTFSAYNVKKFHIASPRFRTMIGSRIQYALKLLKRSGEADSQLVLSKTTGPLDATAIAEFLLIVQESIFEKNKNIGHFIESICFGNMRLALQMFATFLTSGATEVEKMLHIYRRDGAYYVAFHEFLKSIMLGERMYYKEEISPILNLFECGSEKNSSHFTSLRLLAYLMQHRGDACPEGRGYVELSRVLTAFEDIFDNREDFIRCANRMLQNLKQLVEVNTRSTETITGASHIRITSAGWYYVSQLARSFPYIDLTLQDTPLADAGTESELRRLVQMFGNLGSRDEDKKIEHLDARFDRVEKFLAYLAREEKTERLRFGLASRVDVFSAAFVDEISVQYERQRDWIRGRLAQNREAYLVEAADVPTDDFTDDYEEQADQ